jgi:hypothetical protein
MTEEEMQVETTSIFSKVIQDHLDLKRKNSELEPNMPLDRYHSEDPFDNHPLFKTEEQARLEETLDGLDSAADVVANTAFSWPGEDSQALVTATTAATEDDDSGLWTRSRDFDWGD